MNYVSRKDVAARTGVTFLTGKGTVSSGTRVAILQATEELGYAPHVVAGCDDIPLSEYVFPSFLQ